MIYNVLSPQGLRTFLFCAFLSLLFVVLHLYFIMKNPISMKAQTLLLIDKEELSEIIREQIAELVKTLPASVQSPIDPNGSELLTRQQAAQYLHITLPTLNAWTQQGTIKA